MAKNERSLFRIIFREFIKSLTPKFQKHICVGEDYLGTKYFEIKDSKSNHKRASRYFKPANENNFEQELPAEWESWLRYRRTNPPTEEEVKQGYEMILTKRKNAADLEAFYSKSNESENSNVKSRTDHSAIKFPVYEEYKNYGSDYKKKK